MLKTEKCLNTASNGLDQFMYKLPIPWEQIQSTFSSLQETRAWLFKSLKQFLKNTKCKVWQSSASSKQLKWKCNILYLKYHWFKNSDTRSCKQRQISALYLRITIFAIKLDLLHLKQLHIYTRPFLPLSAKLYFFFIFVSINLIQVYHLLYLEIFLFIKKFKCILIKYGCSMDKA